MTARSYTKGSVTVTLSGEMEAFVDRLMETATTAALVTARELAETVRDDAAREWYGARGVRKVTGKSGDIRVTESIDLNTGDVRVSVGSADDRVSGGKPVPVFIKRPGRLSLVKVEVSHDKYWKTSKGMRANYYPIPGRDPRGSTGPWIYEPNPKANDGRKMLNEFIKKPVKKAMRKAASDLGTAVVEGR